MHTATYTQPSTAKSKAKIKQPTAQKLSSKSALKYTGIKSHRELKSALCVDSAVHTDIFNR